MIPGTWPHVGTVPYTTSRMVQSPVRQLTADYRMDQDLCILQEGLQLAL